MTDNKTILRCFFPSHVQAFLALCKTRSFSLAAKSLGTSQSSVSRSVATLENEFGVQLVDHKTRPIRITPQGRLLEESLCMSRNHIEQAMSSIGQANAVRTPFHLGVIESMAELLTQPLVEGLSEQCSNSLVLTGVSTRLLKLLDNERVDFIVTSNSFSHRTDLYRFFLFQEPSVIVTPRQLHFDKPLSWRKLQYCGLPQISFDMENSGALLERKLFNDNGLQFVPRIEVDLNVLLMSMVARNMGWALTRVTALAQFPNYAREVNVWEMPDPMASREIFLICRSETHLALAHLIRDLIVSTLHNVLVPEMLKWAPWIRPYLYIGGGEGPMQRVPVFPDSIASRSVTVF